MKNNFQKKVIGGTSYLNKNCWLAKSLNYPPYERCRYCNYKFRNCLFLHYQVISAVLIISSFSVIFLVERKLSTLLIMVIFSLVIVYGYYFNQSTETIIKSNFSEKKAKEDLEKLTDQLEDKVEEQTKYLKELLEMKNDFLRVVNHQLNTPLSITKGCFSLLKENIYSPDKALPSIESGLERLSSTIADFWDAYELEGERMKMNRQKTDISDIINRLIEEKQRMRLAQERKLTIEIQEPNFQIPLVWCDYKKIAHAVSNLLDNAIHYTREGKVTLFYELSGDYLKINVKDTGVGLSDEDKKRIFKKFSRGKNATDLRPDGSGLGLFIAQKIVEGNDGKMTFFSQGRDKGSTFSFTVPIYKSQKIGLEGEELVSRGKKIVIFDDNNKKKI